MVCRRWDIGPRTPFRAVAGVHNRPVIDAPPAPEHEPPDRSRLARGAIVWFVAADLLAVVIVVAAGLAIARRVAIDEAIGDARDSVRTHAGHVAPQLGPGILAGDGDELAVLDEVVRRRVLSDSVVRVKVWEASGRIVYSDDGALVGRTFELGDDERAAIRSGTTAAELSELGRPENEDERRFGQLLEVYTGVRTPEGVPLLFEAYLRFDRVNDDGARILGAFAPALLGGAAVLFVVQIPLALALRRRVAAAEASRSRLLQQAIDSSERERRRIASDLHDTVVQGLAGSSLALAAMAEEAAAQGDPEVASRLRATSGDLRQWVRQLRTLIVSLVPRRLREEGLVAALTDLVSSLESRGLDVTVDLDPAVDASPATQALVFRAAQEAVRNVVEHAGASGVSLTLGTVGDRVRLVVVDDGRGIDPEELRTARSGGHVGLQLLSDLVAEAGGTLRVDPTPGGGTTVTVEVAAQ